MTDIAVYIDDFLAVFGKAFIFKRWRKNIRQYLLKAGISEVPYSSIGAVFYAFLMLTFAGYFYFIYPMFIGFSLVKIFLYSFIFWTTPIVLMLLFFTAAYVYLDIEIYNRTKKMEDVLQDFLRFLSENLRGGMSFEKALWNSIRPEFGVLANEVRLAAKKVMTGDDVEQALEEFTNKYASPTLKRSFELIVEAMSGGGKIADIIDRVVENIEETKELKQEMTAANLTYVIFVTFIVIFVAPMLFTLSYQFLIVLSSFSSRMGDVSTRAFMNMPLNFSEVKIKPELYQTFSEGCLVIIAFFSGMIVSIIQKGSIKGGVRYIPLFLAGALGMYLLLMQVLGSVFKLMFV